MAAYNIKIITNATGSWVESILYNTTSDVDTNSFNLFFNSSNGYAYIFYNSNASGHIYQLTNATGSWVNTSIYSETLTNGNMQFSGSKDSNNKYHFAINSEDSENDLIYLTNKSGSWVEILISSDIDYSATMLRNVKILINDIDGIFIHFLNDSANNWDYYTNETILSKDTKYYLWSILSSDEESISYIATDYATLNMLPDSFMASKYLGYKYTNTNRYLETKNVFNIPHKEIIDDNYQNKSIWHMDTSTSSYTIKDWDFISKIIVDHTAATGLKQVYLPDLLSNIGKRFSFQNNGLGLTYINSVEGGNILFKGYFLDKMLMIKSGDKLTVLATSDGWLVEDYYMCIESGWYNRSVWTNVHIGFANFDYDNQSDSSDRTGWKYVLFSGVTGLCISDSAPSGTSGTYTVCFVTGTGLAIDDEGITFGDAVTADVNEGSGDNKNQDWDLSHFAGEFFNPIITGWWNDTATYTLAQKLPQSVTGDNADYSIGHFNVDDNNIRIQTGGAGVAFVQDSNGVDAALTTNDVYLNYILEFTL
jgi:hypothetical protein